MAKADQGKSSASVKLMKSSDADEARAPAGGADPESGCVHRLECHERVRADEVAERGLSA